MSDLLVMTNIYLSHLLGQTQTKYVFTLNSIQVENDRMTYTKLLTSVQLLRCHMAPSCIFPMFEQSLLI